MTITTIFRCLLSFIFLILVDCQYDENSQNFPNYCSEYIECASVSLLEERLCLGNSIWRPYWLPQRKDPNKCHQKLKNDYITLERLEEELDGQLTACSNENSKPLEKQTEQSCKLIRNLPRFSFGRSITYVPNHCFTGLKRRIERQCGQIAKCCPTIDKCKLLNSQSTLQNMINSTRENLKKRAADCENGMNVEPLILDRHQFSHDAENEQTWAPSGHVNVNFHDQSSVQRSENSESGFVNVRFSTPTIEERARSLLIRYGDKEVDGVTVPKLSYPPQVTKKDFEKKFDKAIKNTQYYQERIEQLDRNKIAKEGIESLIDAATVSETVNSAPPLGTILHLESNDEENLIVEDLGDQKSSSVSTTSESVTTSPIIFVEKYATPQKKTECKTSTSKVLRFTKIATLLGENPKSKDLQEIQKLIETFEQKLESKVLNERQLRKAKAIEKSLETLLKNFDDEGFKNVQQATEEILQSAENLPPCDSEHVPDVSESIDDENGTMLVDDNGDKILIHKGITTLLVGDEEMTSKNSTEEEDEKTTNFKSFISDEYKAEIEEFRKRHHLWSSRNHENNTTIAIRNETTCDMYMRCRSQMHLAVDSCAWRFASDKLLATMAESAESLLFKDEGVCSQKDGDKYSMLYETMIKRNDKLRTCLEDKNKKFFDESVCLAYSEEERISYDEAIKRLLDTDHEYPKSAECFRDANLIQEKCTNLRDCCPNFDNCREETFDSEMERVIINLTATLNDIKQECVKTKAKEAVKSAVRQLLLSTKAGQKLQSITQLGLDISKGARIVRMSKYRV